MASLFKLTKSEKREGKRTETGIKGAKMKRVLYPSKKEIKCKIWGDFFFLHTTIKIAAETFLSWKYFYESTP